MSVYNYSGAIQSRVYNQSGATIATAYKNDGTVVFQSAKTPHSINDVVSYFQSDTLDVKSQIDALNSDWQSVIFITDPHGAGNENHSQAIALYLLSNTNIKAIILGGDYCYNDWVKSEFDTFAAPFLQSDYIDDIYALFGNHETRAGGTAEAKQSIYNGFLASKGNIHGSPENNYYYFDDVVAKTRFLCINTSGPSQYTIDATQLSWIESAVHLPTSEWSVIVFGHVNIDGLGSDSETNGADIATAVETSNGEVVGYICGHQHIDRLSIVGNNLHAYSLYCDKLENANYWPGLSVTDRQAGTIQEQAVSVISFNTKTKDVVIRRIGVRSPNQTFAFNYGSS